MGEPDKTVSRERLLSFDGEAITVNGGAIGALGTTDAEFAQGLVRQLANVGSTTKKLDQQGIDFVTSVVTGIAPRDQLEAMLAAQMAAVHTAAMDMGRRLAQAETLKQFDSYERALNRLSRTYATQLDALKRYRTGGQQKVVVEHVTVNQGGQAIVGSVQQTTRRREE